MKAWKGKHYVGSTPGTGTPGHNLGIKNEAEEKDAFGGEGTEKVRDAKADRSHFINDKSYQGPGHKLGRK